MLLNHYSHIIKANGIILYILLLTDSRIYCFQSTWKACRTKAIYLNK